MPRLLDAFCGAGGAAVGYHQAGFDDVTGVDIKPQPHYPYEFVQGDAIEFIREHGHEFDAIHASPPCQGYSRMRHLPWLKDKQYPLLIDPTRTLLETTGKPWVIENVMGAKLAAGWLCGTMFGLPFYRHRFFESSFFWMQPGHPRHMEAIRPGLRRPDGTPTLGGRARDLVFSGITAWASRDNAAYRHAKGVEKAKIAMGIDWMNGEELSQAIPPAYTRFIGQHLLTQITHDRPAGCARGMDDSPSVHGRDVPNNRRDNLSRQSIEEPLESSAHPAGRTSRKDVTR